MALDSLRIKGLLGKESGIIPAADKVSTSDIRHWCEVIDEDTTPFDHIDWKERAAPPAMTMVWTMPPLWSPFPGEPSEPHELVLAALDQAGYEGTVGIALAQDFYRPVHVGDRLRYKVKVKRVSSGEVETRMGKGVVVDLVCTVSNQRGQVVSTYEYSLLKFKGLDLVKRPG